MIPEQTVDTADVAGFLLLSPHRVRQLTAEGVLERAVDEKTGEALRGRFNLLATVNSYVRYLRGKLAGGSRGADEYAQARARRMSALATIEELRLKKIHGKLHRSDDVEFLLTTMLTACKQRLLALPSRCCHALQGKSNLVEITQILTGEVETALRELSEYAPAKFEAANEEYLAATGAGKPEAQADRNGTFSPSGADLEKGQ